MRKILIVLAVFFTVVLSLNYIIGVIQTPPWLFFLAPVHYPVDYFYYLSLFTLGQTRWLTAIDLYTHELTKPLLLGSTNVVAGHILSLMGFSPIVAYQITLIAYTLILFLLVVLYLETYYRKNIHARYIAFILFFIANTFPGSASFFSNMTEPLVRFARVPHKMLTLICIMLPMLIITRLQLKKPKMNSKIIMYILLAFCGTIGANINPVQWMLSGAALFLTLLWFHTSKYFNSEIHRKQNIVQYFFVTRSILLVTLFPAIIYTLAGLPMAIYLVNLFKIPPFNWSSAWEYNAKIPMDPLGMFQSFGPVAILAVLGLPIALKMLTLPRACIISYFLLSMLIFFSPIPGLLHLNPIRFQSAITFLGAGILAADFLTGFPIADGKKRLLVAWVMVVALSLYLVPLFVSQYQKSANLDTNNAYIYISTDAYRAFMEAKKRTTLSDVVLVTWPYDGSFPALTGRRGFMGNPDQTINSDTKVQDAYHFFDTQESDAAMHRFLTDNGITYVLEFTSITKILKPFLQIVYQNPLLTLYKVLP